MPTTSKRVVTWAIPSWLGKSIPKWVSILWWTIRYLITTTDSTSTSSVPMQVASIIILWWWGTEWWVIWCHNNSNSSNLCLCSRCSSNCNNNRWWISSNSNRCLSISIPTLWINNHRDHKALQQITMQEIPIQMESSSFGETFLVSIKSDSEYILLTTISLSLTI